MSLAIRGSSISKSGQEVEVTLQVAKGSHVEFAEELGLLGDQLDNQFIQSYLAGKYPDVKIDRIRLVYLGRWLGTLSANDLQIHQAPE